MQTQQVALTISGESQAHSESFRVRLINEWLLKFAVAYPPQGNREPVVTEETAPLLASIWSEALADIPTEALEPAFRATLKTSKWFPTVAEITSHIERAEDSRAEDEWQRLLEYCSRYVNPDLGMARAPKLPPDIEHAALAAGGLYYLESCPAEELVWRKKAFIEDLTRQRKTGDIAVCLPESRLGKLLAQVAPRFSLPVLPIVTVDSRAPLEVLRSLKDAPSEPFYGLRKRENDPALVAWQEKRAATDPMVVEYRKAHGL